MLPSGDSRRPDECRADRQMEMTALSSVREPQPCRQVIVPATFACHKMLISCRVYASALVLTLSSWHCWGEARSPRAESDCSVVSTLSNMCSIRSRSSTGPVERHRGVERHAFDFTHSYIGLKIESWRALIEGAYPRPSRKPKRCLFRHRRDHTSMAVRDRGRDAGFLWGSNHHR